ncbi:MAG: hypothetical protein HDR43_01445 [Mycoplasma sp.]|nr:hypothetical protein [Mycoplasma sp.]
MKINFKSTRTEHNDEPKIIEFTSRVDIEKEDDDFIALTFDENRNGKIITNRIEYNFDTLRIYSGVSSIQCKLNEIIKNNFVVDDIKTNFYIYTKMINIDISNKNDLVFEYFVSPDSDFNQSTKIKLELTIKE